MDRIKTLKYLNSKYADNGVKFESTGEAIRITDGENVMYFNEKTKKKLIILLS